MEDMSLDVLPDRSKSDFPIADCNEANLNDPVNIAYINKCGYACIV